MLKGKLVCTLFDIRRFSDDAVPTVIVEAAILDLWEKLNGIN